MWLDQLLYLLLRSSILGLVAACLVVATTFLYSAMFDLIGGRWQSAAVSLTLACCCATAFTQLWRYRNDLIYY